MTHKSMLKPKFRGCDEMISSAPRPTRLTIDWPTIAHLLLCGALLDVDDHFNTYFFQGVVNGSFKYPERVEILDFRIVGGER